MTQLYLSPHDPPLHPDPVLSLASFHSLIWEFPTLAVELWIRGSCFSKKKKKKGQGPQIIVAMQGHIGYLLLYNKLSKNFMV